MNLKNFLKSFYKYEFHLKSFT